MKNSIHFNYLAAYSWAWFICQITSVSLFSAPALPPEIPQQILLETISSSTTALIAPGKKRIRYSFLVDDLYQKNDLNALGFEYGLGNGFNVGVGLAPSVKTFGQRFDLPMINAQGRYQFFHRGKWDVAFNPTLGWQDGYHNKQMPIKIELVSTLSAANHDKKLIYLHLLSNTALYFSDARSFESYRSLSDYDAIKIGISQIKWLKPGQAISFSANTILQKETRQQLNLVKIKTVSQLKKSDIAFTAGLGYHIAINHIELLTGLEGGVFKNLYTLTSNTQTLSNNSAVKLAVSRIVFNMNYSF